MLKGLFSDKNGDFSLKKYYTILVLIPVFVYTLYAVSIKADTYSSRAIFSVYNNQESTPYSGIEEHLASLSVGGLTTSNLQETLILKEYLATSDAIQKLSEIVNIKEIYSKVNLDAFSALKKEASIHEVQKYLQNMITIKVDRESNIIETTTKAFDAHDAQLINESLNIVSKNFLQQMLKDVKNSNLEAAREFTQSVKDKLIKAKQELSDFRIKHAVLDPFLEIENRLKLTGAMEETKGKLLIENSQKESLLNKNSQPVKETKLKIENIKKLIEQTKSNIILYAEEKSEMLYNYEVLYLNQKLAEQEYQMALINLESSVRSLSVTDKHLVDILKPTIDYNNDSETLYDIIKLSILLFLLASLALFINASIRDHMQI